MNRFISAPVRSIVVSFIIGLLVTLTVIPSFATGTPPQVAWIAGAKMIPMGDNLAQLNLPVGYSFANAADTSKILEHLGNTPSKQDIGMVVPNTSGQEWLVVYRYDPMGYVKDEEAQSIDKNAILEAIKAGTEEGNKRRQTQGQGGAKIIVTGWQEEPHYDAISHNLIWSIAATEDDRPLINYNTRKLGRSGVTSINLVTTPTDLPTLKPAVEALIAGYDYLPGNKYTDFVAGKDKVAEIGLMALIAGGAGVAAKTGVFAKIFLFLAIIFKKAWIFIAIGVGALFKKAAGSKPSPKTTTLENEADRD
jgi:uncharacterized membrane-anchored protein